MDLNLNKNGSGIVPKNGDFYYQNLDSILVFDALIYNDDRHFGNFGLLRDNRTGKFIGTAPLFDHG